MGGIRKTGGEVRRAANMVWNAAARYDFEPPFLAYHEDGSADFYFNTIIGLSEKWLEREKLDLFFSSYAHSVRAQDLDTIAWLAIEHLLYEKESTERMMLSAMRRDYAQAFFDAEQTLSRQEMMARAPKVYEQQRARWGDVLGKKRNPMTPGAKRLHEALQIPQETDTPSLIGQLQDVFVRDFHFRDFRLTKETQGIAVGDTLSAALRNVMHRERKHKDALIVRSGAIAEGKRERAALFLARSLHKEAQDEDDIRSCFGESLFDEHRMRQIENDCCREDHADARLWYASGIPVQEEIVQSEAKRFSLEIEKQHEKNLAFFNRSSVVIASAIRTLTAQLDTILSTYKKPLPERSRAGDLQTQKAFRLQLLKDPYVFTHPGDETENHLSVDLLLDASSSRAKAQEIIAAQAYILAKSLMACHVPVQIVAFRSIRGFTVLQPMKTYHDTDLKNLFRYCAAGWNRDGLALRALPALMEGGGETKLLLVLTDAHPIDSLQMPPEEGSVFSREYDNMAAVNDTALAVKALRKQGIMTGAIFTGLSSFLENVHAIYGRHYVRVRKMPQLAQGAGALLGAMLREKRN